MMQSLVEFYEISCPLLVSAMHTRIQRRDAKLGTQVPGAHGLPIENIAKDGP